MVKISFFSLWRVKHANIGCNLLVWWGIERKDKSNKCFLEGSCGRPTHGLQSNAVSMVELALANVSSRIKFDCGLKYEFQFAI